MKATYTDETLAERPPGGKVHKPPLNADVLPSEAWRLTGRAGKRGKAKSGAVAH